MRVVVDKGKCSGHGRCFAINPDFYGFDDQGFNTVVDAYAPASEQGVRDGAAAVLKARSPSSTELPATNARRRPLRPAQVIGRAIFKRDKVLFRGAQPPHLQQLQDGGIGLGG